MARDGVDSSLWLRFTLARGRPPTACILRVVQRLQGVGERGPFRVQRGPQRSFFGCNTTPGCLQTSIKSCPPGTGPSRVGNAAAQGMHVTPSRQGTATITEVEVGSPANVLLKLGESTSAARPQEQARQIWLGAGHRASRASLKTSTPVTRKTRSCGRSCGDAQRRRETRCAATPRRRRRSCGGTQYGLQTC